MSVRVGPLSEVGVPSPGERRGETHRVQEMRRVCPMSLEVDAMVKEGKMESSECILCGTCVDNCPEDAISFASKSGTRS